MGDFSHQFAISNPIQNVREGEPFKVLIPKEFGSGRIIDEGYIGYGNIFSRETGKETNWYDLVAEWNKDYYSEIIEKTKKEKEKAIQILISRYPFNFSTKFARTEFIIRKEELEDFKDKLLKELQEKNDKHYYNYLLGLKVIFFYEKT